MKLATVAKLTAGIALAALVACVGTGRVSVEAPFIGIEAEWEKAPEPVEDGKEYIYRVTGKSLEAVRGEEYKAVFRDAEGKQIGEHAGEVPAEGPLEIPAPADAHTVDWATGDDIEALDFAPPAILIRAQQAGLFRVLRSTVNPSGGKVMEFAFSLHASSLDAALDRAHEIASFAPLAQKPQDVFVHYFVRAIQQGVWINVISMKQGPSPTLWVDLNRSWANDDSVDVSQNGWNARAVVAPVSALNLTGSNSIRVVHGPVDFHFDFEPSL